MYEVYFVTIVYGLYPLPASPVMERKINEKECESTPSSGFST
jgi:hypothetical protein